MQYQEYSRGFGVGRPPGTVAQVRQALLADEINVPTYFGVLCAVATGQLRDGEVVVPVPVRQRVEAAVYLLNRHLGTPTSVVDIKTVHEARLSADDLLEIAQLVRSLPQLLTTGGDSPPSTTPAICDADNTPHSEDSQIR